ncbi:hypothetical protein ACOMHN_020043 [Nucella lapillus]
MKEHTSERVLLAALLVQITLGVAPSDTGLAVGETCKETADTRCMSGSQCVDVGGTGGSTFQCRLKVGQTCTASDNCAANAQCADTGGGNLQCRLKIGQTCTADSSCAANAQCVDIGGGNKQCRAITDDNSLFMYEGGWGTSRYTNDSFQPLFLSEIPNQKLAESLKECGGAEDLSCIYDFVATDDKDLATSTKAANDRLKVNIEMADIKECVQAPSPCDQQCSNTEGSYTCSCDPGFQSKGTDCVGESLFLTTSCVLQGDSTLTKGKQKLSAEIIIPDGLPIAGNIIRKVFVSMKGLLSFGRKYDSFNVRSLPVPGFHLMCAYWADLQLPFNDEANVWHQVYRRNENNTAKELAMLTKGGQRVKQYANIDSYLPAVVLVVTFEKVPLEGSSTDTTERVNFQMVVVSDGFTTYGVVMYPSGGMQVDSRLNRPVTIGYLNKTFSEVTSPDTLTGNTDHDGVWFYPLSKHVDNAAQKCMNWYFRERLQVKSYRTAIPFLAPCPCVKLLAEISTTMRPEDVIDDVACFLTTPTSTKTPYAQRCCYKQTTGGFIQTRPLAGSFLLYHPEVNPRGHSLMDIRPKEHCCQHSQLCGKYYEVRPISTCQFFIYNQCMATGDPHITTLDGKTFPFNAVGEFTLLRFQQPGFELQARTCVATSREGTFVAASVFCAFAAKGSNSTFQVEMNKNKTDLNVVVDRQDLTRKFQTDASFSRTFAGLSVDRTQNGAVKAFFTEGVGLTVSVKNRQLTIEVGVYGNTSGLQPPTGLLGNLNGNAEDDFICPNGTTLPNNTSEQDLLGYGKTWAVTDDNSLFMYERGWGTSRYTNDSFQPLFLSEIPEQKLAEAHKECGGAEDLSCIYDFVATDDKDLANSTKAANDWLKVNKEIAGNVAPTLSGPARIEVILGQTTSVTFSAKDEDDVTAPKFLMQQLLTGFTFNETTQTFQFTPNSTNLPSME